MDYESMLKAGKDFLLVGIVAIMLIGCATRDKPLPEGGVNTLESVPHQYLTNIKTGQKGSRSENERFHLYPGSGVTVKQPAAFPAAKESGGNITLNFEGVDVREVLRTILGDILRENYIVDPRVSGSITMRTAKPIPKAAAMHTLEEVLRMNGAAIVRESDGVLRVLPSAAAGKGNLTPQLMDGKKPLPPGYSIQIVPLKYIGVADMSKMLEPLVAEPASVKADPVRNLLILSGTQLQLQHMLETVDMFDVDWISGMSIGLFTLQSAEVKTVQGELEKLFGDKNLGPLAGALRVVPIERLNALLVVTPQAKYLEQAKLWVERLDRAGLGGGGQRLFVYQVQNGKAESLAALLNDAFSKKAGTASKAATAPALEPGAKPAEVKSSDQKPAATSPAPAPGPSGDGMSVPQDVRVIADKDNNALLILAAAADYERIEAALKKLDVLPRQVLIEVTIAEVTLTDEFSMGLEWFFNNGSRIQGKLDSGSAGIAQLAPGLSFSWKNAVGDVNAVLNMLDKDSRLNIISSPHITVADNQTAKIQVGDRVPTISQTQATTTTTGVIESVQYVETGVLLSVTPRVNAGGQVTMEINQEVSNATETTTSSINSPTIQRRTAESTVTVQNGETLILGGLINEKKSKASDGLPYLSEIPLLGGLFGKQSYTDNRTEMIILITPRVLLNSQDAVNITAEYRKRLTGLESMLKTVRVESDDMSVREAQGKLKLRMSAPMDAGR